MTWLRVISSGMLFEAQTIRLLRSFASWQAFQNCFNVDGMAVVKRHRMALDLSRVSSPKSLALGTGCVQFEHF